MLIENPVSDKEVGWNSAIIRLLKPSPFPKKFEHPLVKLGIPDSFIEAINEHCRAGNKLMAVKTIKECTALGLKEAKDTLDFYAETGLWKQ
jgi:hypothetical protein